MRRTNRKSEQGVSLLFALLALMVLTAVAVGMMYMSSTETAINANFKAEETAYLAARAGVEEARDRMLPANPNTISALLPTTLPSTTGGVLYLKQTGVTDADITNVSMSNPTGDDELCHDFPYAGSGYGGMTPLPPNIRCTSLPTGGWYTTTPSVAPYALEYKWVRITLKANNSTPYPVDSSLTGSQASSQACWNGKSEVALVGAASCDALIPNATPVYLVTSLAVTPSGARRIALQELAQAPPVTGPNDGFFATGTGCSAMQVGGSAQTGSFNSATQNPPTNPPSNQSKTNGNVGANGNVFVNGNKTGVNGSITTNLPATIGACPANGITTSGGPTIGAPTPLPAPYNPPVPPLPNPLPPQTTTVYRNTTLSPGAYGNITLQGNVTLTGGTPGNPAVYTINSLALNGNANLQITGPVVINLAGVGQANVLNMTGGSFSNSTYVPGNFAINYGGSGSMVVAGGNAAFAVINAPNAAISFHGGSKFYGSAIGNTINDLGGTSLYWDMSLQTPPPVNNSLFHEISLRELSY